MRAFPRWLVMVCQLHISLKTVSFPVTQIWFHVLPFFIFVKGIIKTLKALTHSVVARWPFLHAAMSVRPESTDYSGIYQFKKRNSDFQLWPGIKQKQTETVQSVALETRLLNPVLQTACTHSSALPESLESRQQQVWRMLNFFISNNSIIFIVLAIFYKARTHFLKEISLWDVMTLRL